MTGQLIETPRGSFMEAAQKEMIAFERKERELRKKKNKCAPKMFVLKSDLRS
jgi:hypothetical protein